MLKAILGSISIMPGEKGPIKIDQQQLKKAAENSNLKNEEIVFTLEKFQGLGVVEFEK